MRNLLPALFLLLSLPAHAVSPFQVLRNVYSVTPVTTSAWVQLSAKLIAPARSISVFDSSGQILVLGIGISGSEVAQTWYIYPGGTDMVPVNFPLNARLTIEAISGTASAGEIDINLYQ